MFKNIFYMYMPKSTMKRGELKVEIHKELIRYVKKYAINSRLKFH